MSRPIGTEGMQCISQQKRLAGTVYHQQKCLHSMYPVHALSKHGLLQPLSPITTSGSSRAPSHQRGGLHYIAWMHDQHACKLDRRHMRHSRWRSAMPLPLQLSAGSVTIHSKVEHAWAHATHTAALTISFTYMESSPGTTARIRSRSSTSALST